MNHGGGAPAPLSAAIAPDNSLPDPALVFRLNARSGFQQQPADIDGEAENENQREQRDQTHSQGEVLPHDRFRSTAVSRSPRMPLTDKNDGYLIERYSIFVAYAYGGASRFKMDGLR